MEKIITSYDYPPIPIRNYDWSAIRESYDEGDLIGYGKTEQEAIGDLIEIESESDLSGCCCAAIIYTDICSSCKEHC